MVIEAYRQAAVTYRLAWRRLVPIFLLLAILDVGERMVRPYVIKPGPDADMAAGLVQVFGVMGLSVGLDSLFTAIAFAMAWWAVMNRRPKLAPVLKLAVAVWGLELAAALGGQVLGGILAAIVLSAPLFGGLSDSLWRGIPYATTIILVGMMQLYFVRLYVWFLAREAPSGRFWAYAWLLSALVMMPQWLWGQLARAAPDGTAITLMLAVVQGAVVHPLFALALVHAYCLWWPQPEAVPEAA